MRNDYEPLGSFRDCIDAISKMRHDQKQTEQNRLLEEQARLQKEAVELQKQRMALDQERLKIEREQLERQKHTPTNSQPTAPRPSTPPPSTSSKWSPPKNYKFGKDWWEDQRAIRS